MKILLDMSIADDHYELIHNNKDIILYKNYDVENDCGKFHIFHQYEFAKILQALLMGTLERDVFLKTLIWSE